MMRLESKVVFVTGAARGQGRSHAVRLAEEGANIIAIDLCGQVEAAQYPLSNEDDLEETRRLVAATGRGVLVRRVDVRDQEALDSVVAEGIEEFGKIDIVCANAGITAHAKAWEMSDAAWNDVVDICLTGVWRTVKAAVPSMIAAGAGGSIVITSSTAGLHTFANHASYCAAKYGVVGLAGTLAIELAEYDIRVNTIHPTSVNTPMIQNSHEYELFMPDHPNPGRDDVAPVFQSLNLLPIPWVEPVEISNAIIWLVSDEARHVTGIQLPIDAGCLAK
jgi:SDR family mycofactocin-dependent oxidoreductase